MRSRSASFPLLAMILIDAAVFGAWYYCIPRLNRPLDALLIAATVLCLATALVVKRAFPRGLLVAVAATALALFAVEMGQKFFNILNLTEAGPDAGAPLEGPYAWEVNDAADYLQARKKAWKDGILDENPEAHFAGDIYAGVDRAELSVVRRDEKKWRMIREGDKPLYLVKPPLGYEHNPNCRVREYVEDTVSGAIVHDGVYDIDGAGCRVTRGNENSNEVYVFLGCSNTFGMYLNDDQTLPYYFSEALGFEKRVVNLAVSGHGPGQALRELRLGYHLGKAGIRPAEVKGVYFGLIDGHTLRVEPPVIAGAPYYTLEDGKPVFKGAYAPPASAPGRFERLLKSDRIYPILRDRLGRDTESGDLGYKWQLVIAMVVEMDRICREHYGVPLTVFYWDETPAVAEKLRESGIMLVTASEVFGESWRDLAIKYYLYDRHPSAYANKELGVYLAKKRCLGNNNKESLQNNGGKPRQGGVER